MFYEIRFPESISIKSTTSIEFDTSIITSKNGKEQRISTRDKSRMIFDITTGIKTKKDLDEIVSFFRVVNGNAIGFRFKDWLDYSVKNQILGLGNGKEKTFQLIKSYSFSVNNKSINYIRKITKPVKGKVSIFIDSNDITDSVDINYENGEVSFSSAPEEGKIISANFEFDVPVRFESNILKLSLNSPNSGEIKDIKIVEIL